MTLTIKPIYTPEFFKNEEPIKEPAKLWHAWWEALVEGRCLSFAGVIVPVGTIEKAPLPYHYPSKEIAEQKALEGLERVRKNMGMDCWRLVGIYPVP